MITNSEIDLDKNIAQTKLRFFATIMPFSLKLILSFNATNLVCNLNYLIIS